MKLKEIQKTFKKYNDDVLKELEKEIRKGHKVVYKEIRDISTRYSDKFNGEVLPGPTRLAMNKEISKRVATVLKPERLLYDKALSETFNNIYKGYAYSYSKVSNSFIKYKSLTDAQLKIIKLDKIKGKTYIERLNFHSKNLIDSTSSIIQNGIRNGLSNQQMAKKIAERVGVSERHGLTIAKTETGRIGSIAAEKAQDAALEQGLKFNKIWFHYASSEPREDHIDMDGVKVKAGEYFTLPNGERCQYPRVGLSAEETINCLCDVIEEFVGFESSERRQGKDIVDVGSYSHYRKNNGE